MNFTHSDHFQALTITLSAIYTEIIEYYSMVKIRYALNVPNKISNNFVVRGELLKLWILLLNLLLRLRFLKVVIRQLIPTTKLIREKNHKTYT